MSAARTQTPSPKKSEPALTFEWERLDRALGEGLEDMLAAHWEEEALDKDTVALAIDWDRYRRLERDEVLGRGKHVFVARGLLARERHAAKHAPIPEPDKRFDDGDA